MYESTKIDMKEDGLEEKRSVPTIHDFGELKKKEKEEQQKRVYGTIQ